jgi:hypothetical protein
MGQIEKPKTQKEQIDQMWMVLIGYNGDGIATITKKNHEDIQQIKMHIQRFEDTRLETCPTKTLVNDMWEGQKKSRKRSVDVRLVIYGLIVGLVAAVPGFLMALGG